MNSSPIYSTVTWSRCCLPPRSQGRDIEQAQPKALRDTGGNIPNLGGAGCSQPHSPGAWREGTPQEQPCWEEHGRRPAADGDGFSGDGPGVNRGAGRAWSVQGADREATGPHRGYFGGPPCPQRARHAWWASRARPRLGLLFATSLQHS